VQTFSNGIIKTVKTPEGKKVKHYKILDDYVVGEWIKFQEYADVYL
jgi:hypothetical protein